MHTFQSDFLLPGTSCRLKKSDETIRALSERKGTTVQHRRDDDGSDGENQIASGRKKPRTFFSLDTGDCPPPSPPPWHNVGAKQKSWRHCTMYQDSCHDTIEVVALFAETFSDLRGSLAQNRPKHYACVKN